MCPVNLLASSPPNHTILDANPSHSSYFDQLVVFILPFRTVLPRRGALCCRLACIVLSNDLGVDTVQFLLREDAQQRPSKVK